MNRRVQLCRRGVARDTSTGEDLGAWSPFATVWAAVKPVTGRESWAAQQRFAEIDTVFTMRWRADVDVEVRVVYEGRAYDVTAALEVGNREALDVLATARAEV
jgi:SPP1 family predicted phage head-tail adaptor